MRTLLLAGLLMAALATFPANAATDGTPAVNAESGQGRAEAAGSGLLGLPGPAATLTTLEGERIDLGAYYGKKPVYLKFWATWCVPCREQMPGFEADYEALGDRMAIIAVNTGFNDKPATVRDFRQKMGLRMPVAVDDGSLAAALNLRVTPQHVVIGRDGRILYVGHLADDKLHQALQAALAEGGSAAGIATAPGHPQEATYKPGDILPGLTTSITTGQAFPVGGPSRDGKPRAVLFFSPWCESYLATSRPAMAAACRQAREVASSLADQGQAHWLGVASGLWASAKDLADYQANPKTPVPSGLPLTLDADGHLFRAFGVREVPSLAIIDAKGRITRILGPEEITLATAQRTVAQAR
ncbi:redoxin domain-containing protein [Nitrospirillum viridazoti]|uniref:Thiol-disulfide isomerase/thioredoxin n=2 Tax=Nitrospirillum TaxID=1543705 RepID=A0A560HPP9_9PROT|nr:redoxin domain-containing protein [Nitrospirillum amazonense]TWB47060.1 thiol-disulfide isomerase/thioredoxin [Nitrospirillum amazonense]